MRSRALYQRNRKGAERNSQGEALFRASELPQGAPAVASSSSLPSYETGRLFATPGAGRFLEDTDTVHSGDVLRISYRLRIPFLQKFQVAAYEYRLRQDSRIELLHFVHYEEEGTITITVRLISPFSPPFIVAAALAAVGIGIGVFLLALSVEKLTTVKTPIGDFNIGAVVFTGILGYVAVKALTGASTA